MRVSLALAISLCPIVLSGCSAITGITSTNTAANSPSTSGATIRGIVHGGQSPISGAHLYLLAMPNTGYYAGPGIPASTNNASVSLLNSSVLSQSPAGGVDGNGNYYVTTDSSGNFTISPNSTYDYTCPSAYSYTYLYSVGGNPGLASGTNNTAATLLAGVDACNTSSYRVVNEVSTIAAIYAYAGFITDPLHVSSSDSTLAQTALNNSAQSSMKNLYTPSTGVANTATAGGNGTVPTAEIDTLANILAACVNSTGSGSPNCSALWTAATGGTASDTTTAAVNIAHNPGANVSALFALQAASGAPFQPDLSTAPNDWTIALSFTGGGLTDSNFVAIDGSDNVWVTNGSIGNNVITGDVSEFSPSGEALSGSTGFTAGGVDAPSGIAIGGSGNVWVANMLGTAPSISEINSSGGAVGGSPFTGGGLAFPPSGTPANGLAIDTSNNVWAVSDGSTILSEFNSSGSPVSNSGYSGGGFSGGLNLAIALDAASDLWAPSSSGISEFVLGPNSWSNHSPFDGGSVDEIAGLAVDGSNNVWVANYGSSTISEFLFSSGSWSTNSPMSGGGVSSPVGLAIDGAGNVWAGNNGNASIGEFNSSGTALSGPSGYKATSLGHVIGLAIDGAGNVWVASNTSTNDAITEFIGLASPVVTPIVANFLSPYSHAASKP